MDEHEWMAQQFEDKRANLRAVAYRMLGSLSEAEDAVQEAWLRLSRSDASDIRNLGGWLTTVIARVCLDMLRARKSRREQPLDTPMPETAMGRQAGFDPESETVLADSVGLALLVVLERLTPAERLAFVLHDLFAMPFAEIAPIVGRSPAAARQLASRARRRVRGGAAPPDADLTRQREIVKAFLAAARCGDFEALLALLDPDVLVKADHAAAPLGTAMQVRGAQNVAEQALIFSRRARFAQLAIVNGAVGVVVAPRGRLIMVMAFKFTGMGIGEIDIIADPTRLRKIDLAVLDG